MAATSKGIDFTSFAEAEGFEVQLEIDGNIVKRTSRNDLSKNQFLSISHHEVVTNLPIAAASQRIFIRAKVNNTVVFERNWRINPSSGNASSDHEGNPQDMLSLYRQRSEVSGEWAVSTGFFDAPGGLIADKTASGDDRITSRDLVYIYMTRNHESWMGDLLKKHPEAGKASLSKFVVIGAHNAGNFTSMLDDIPQGMQSPEKFSQGASAALAELVKSSGHNYEKEITSLGKKLNPNTMASLLTKMGNTQKDNIDTQLRLGVRHFDFRPGYNHPSLRGDDIIRQQHGFIQGHWYKSFLEDVVGFLKSHPGEIVTVTASANGFMQSRAKEMKPDDAVLDKMISDALAGSGIQRGNQDDVNKDMSTLLSENRRLLFIGSARDSYSSTENCTTNMERVRKQCEKTLDNESAEPADPQKSLVLQLQATATETRPGQIQSVRAGRDIGSSLLMTKMMGNHLLYNWLNNGADIPKKSKSYTVLLTDFVDNASVSLAIDLTKRRILGA